MKPLAVATFATAVALAIIVYRRYRRRLTPKFAYLNVENAPKWKDQLEIFARALDIPVENFERFDCFEGELPTKEALSRGDFTGVLITGSHFSCKDPALPWLHSLFACITTCAALPHVNLLGCCFGCQAIAIALGGSVGPNPGGGFVFGAEAVEVALDLAATHTYTAAAAAAAATAGTPPPTATVKSHVRMRATVRLLESHGEQVLSLPHGSVLLASSEGTPNELFLTGGGEHHDNNSNVLCCQSHPEFDPELLASRIEPALIEKGRLSKEQLDSLRADPASFYGCGGDPMVVRRLYRDFLLHGSGVALCNLRASLRANLSSELVPPQEHGGESS